MLPNGWMHAGRMPRRQRKYRDLPWRERCLCRFALAANPAFPAPVRNRADQVEPTGLHYRREE